MFFFSRCLRQCPPAEAWSLVAFLVSACSVTSLSFVSRIVKKQDPHSDWLVFINFQFVKIKSPPETVWRPGLCEPSPRTSIFTRRAERSDQEVGSGDERRRSWRRRSEASSHQIVGYQISPCLGLHVLSYKWFTSASVRCHHCDIGDNVSTNNQHLVRLLPICRA